MSKRSKEVAIFFPRTRFTWALWTKFGASGLRDPQSRYSGSPEIHMSSEGGIHESYGPTRVSCRNRCSWIFVGAKCSLTLPGRVGMTMLAELASRSEERRV